jgi:hypothetical protein
MLNQSPLLRAGITFVLAGLLITSIVCMKNIVTSTWQGQQREDALYNRSPNCGGTSDASNIDPSLPPCQKITASVISKPQYTTVDHRRYHDYVRAHRQLTLQFSNGRTQTVGDIYEDMWNSILFSTLVPRFGHTVLLQREASAQCRFYGGRNNGTC